MRTYLILVSAMSAALLACKPETKQLADQLETAQSSLATLDAVVERWSDNRVPVRYAELTIGESRKQLHAAAQRLEHMGRNATLRGAALGTITHAEKLSDSIERAVRARDRARARLQLSALAPDLESLGRLVDEAKSLP